MYPEITIDIQEIISIIENSKTLEMLNPIKSDSINYHENIIAIQR
jgi:hypothetical protein